MESNLLAAFEHVYTETLHDYALQARIQQVKDALYRRSYEEAFGSKENLCAYVVRWSPSRALAYAHIFQNYSSIRKVLAHSSNVLCIGGGAGAEIAALSTFPEIKVWAADLGDWEAVTGPLARNLNINTTFLHGDAMTMPLKLESFQMVTCLFTTNELFAESKAKAIRFLHSLIRCPPGCLFVVIESAGSYSEIQVGNKKFPIYFLIHHALTIADAWQLKDEKDSEWYRISSEIASCYPLELQNMRYFLRVYERQSSSQ